MERRPLRRATWPVMLVTGIAVAGCVLLLHTDADDLDPVVWQAIVDRADLGLPALLEPLTGEI